MESKVCLVTGAPMSPYCLLYLLIHFFYFISPFYFHYFFYIYYLLEYRPLSVIFIQPTESKSKGVEGSEKNTWG